MGLVEIFCGFDGEIVVDFQMSCGFDCFAKVKSGVAKKKKKR